MNYVDVADSADVIWSDFTMMTVCGEFDCP